MVSSGMDWAEVVVADRQGSDVHSRVQGAALSGGICRACRDQKEVSSVCGLVDRADADRKKLWRKKGAKIEYPYKE